MDNSQPIIEQPVKKKKSHGFLLFLIGTLLGVALSAGLAYYFKDKIPFLSTKCPEQQKCPTNTTTCDCKKNTSTSNDLDIGFLQLEYNNQNMIYSPLSIKSALFMLKDGAAGETKSEIENVLGDATYNQYNDVKDKVSFANSFFINDQSSVLVSEDYKNTIKEKYNAESIVADFSTPKAVNDWISAKTFKLIENMFNDISIHEAILINALAIDLKWATQFETENTGGKTFYKNDGSTMTATTMNNQFQDKAAYYDGDDYKAVSLPLEKIDGVDLEYVAIMPNDLDEYIKTLTKEEIDNVVNNMEKAIPDKRLALSIPKYKFDYDLDFKIDLKTLGIQKIFTSDADLSIISPALYVSDAKHKAVIEFSEDGIKAAAVTAFFMDESAMYEPEYKVVSININKPFLFIIREVNTKDIWFIGTVNEPNNWDKDKAEYNRAY